MRTLKKENWIVHLFLTIITGGLYFFVLARDLDLYDAEAWYCDYRYWTVALLCFFFPVILLLLIFLIQMICEVAKKLQVPGQEIYSYLYAWILCIIVPVLGWSLFLVMLIYLMIWSNVRIEQGAGED